MTSRYRTQAQTPETAPIDVPASPVLDLPTPVQAEAQAPEAHLTPTGV